MVASSHGRPVTKQSSMVKHLLHGRSRDHILELGANTALRQGTANTARRARRRLQGEMRTGVALASDIAGVSHADGRGSTLRGRPATGLWVG